jgi:hypothetical protein
LRAGVDLVGIVDRRERVCSLRRRPLKSPARNVIAGPVSPRLISFGAFFEALRTAASRSAVSGLSAETGRKRLFSGLVASMSSTFGSEAASLLRFARSDNRVARTARLHLVVVRTGAGIRMAVKTIG